MDSQNIDFYTYLQRNYPQQRSTTEGNENHDLHAKFQQLSGHMKRHSMQLKKVPSNHVTSSVEWKPYDSKPIDNTSIGESMQVVIGEDAKINSIPDFARRAVNQVLFKQTRRNQQDEFSEIEHFNKSLESQREKLQHQYLPKFADNEKNNIIANNSAVTFDLICVAEQKTIEEELNYYKMEVQRLYEENEYIKKEFEMRISNIQKIAQKETENYAKQLSSYEKQKIDTNRAKFFELENERLESENKRIKEENSNLLSTFKTLKLNSIHLEGYKEKSEALKLENSLILEENKTLRRVQAELEFSLRNLLEEKNSLASSYESKLNNLKAQLNLSNPNLTISDVPTSVNNPEIRLPLNSQRLKYSILSSGTSDEYGRFETYSTS